MTLLDRDPGAPNAWDGNLPVTNRYTYGLAGERFFRAIKDEGRILGSRCQHCDRTYVPAASFCERCLSELDDWVDVGVTGEVYTFTINYTAMDSSASTAPEIIAFVQIADGGIVHRLGQVNPDDVAIGLPVEAIFLPKEERKGSILDIEYFRPIRA